jgi:hypothetical protein
MTNKKYKIGSGINMYNLITMGGQHFGVAGI